MPRQSAGSTDVLMFDWSWSLPVAPSEIMRVRLRRLPTSRLRFVRAPRLTPAASPAHLSAPFSSRAPSHPRLSDAIWRGSWILTREDWGLGFGSQGGRPELGAARPLRGRADQKVGTVFEIPSTPWVPAGRRIRSVRLRLGPSRPSRLGSVVLASRALQPVIRRLRRSSDVLTSPATEVGGGGGPKP